MCIHSSQQGREGGWPPAYRIYGLNSLRLPHLRRRHHVHHGTGKGTSYALSSQHRKEGPLLALLKPSVVTGF